jgi:hypothetical protein
VKKRLFAGLTTPNVTTRQLKICITRPEDRFPCSWIDIYNISLLRVSAKARSEFAVFTWKCFCLGASEIEF